MNKQVLCLAVACGTIFQINSVIADGGKISGNEFNPAISLILDGRYSSYDNEFELPGFQVGGEAGLPEKGFSLGHTELTVSANIDDKLFGYFNAAMEQEEGESIFELEEVYIESIGLGEGATIKAGRFYSGLGYLNGIHDHAHDFADVPLVYAGMVGNHLIDTGVQARWLAPTDIFMEFGVEALSGSGFPGGENEDNNKGRTIFAKFGGDINVSSSWLAGVSVYSSEFDVREAGGHTHGGGSGVDNELLDGEVDLTAVEFVYKWAPNGNTRNRYLKLQFEYFMRDENGEAEFDEGGEQASADYDGEQEGYYIQAVYQWQPRWRVGLRYEHLESDNKIANFDGNVDGAGSTFTPEEFLEETGLDSEHDPERVSLMVDYSPSEFSRFRVQYNNDDSGHESDNQLYLQYSMSLGSHGAHKF